jgi:hypothetical protein
VAGDVNDALRAEVARRANYRCEYCLIREDDAGFRHQVDHVLSRKHGGVSSLENLAYACILCNRRKGSDVASVDSQTGTIIPLFHPRRDRWAEHFRIDGELIQPLTAVGRVTLQLLRLNAPERLSERRLLQTLGVYPPPVANK